MRAGPDPHGDGDGGDGGTCAHCHKTHQPLDAELDLVVLLHNAGPVLVKDQAQKKASKGEGDWRDVRALLIYREADVAGCSKGGRQT